MPPSSVVGIVPGNGTSAVCFPYSFTVTLPSTKSIFCAEKKETSTSFQPHYADQVVFDVRYEQRIAEVVKQNKHPKEAQHAGTEDRVIATAVSQLKASKANPATHTRTIFAPVNQC